MNLGWVIVILAVVWQVTPWCLRTILNEKAEIREVDWAADGSTLISVSKGNKVVRIYDGKSLEVMKTFTYQVSGNVQDPSSAKISKNSLYIGISYLNGHVVILYNIPPYNIYFIRFTGQAKTVEMDFRYDSTFFVACGDDQTIRTFPLPATGAANGTATPTINHDFGNNGDKGWTCRYGPQNDIVQADDNKHLRMYRPSQSTVQFDFPTMSDKILELDFKPASSTIAVVSKEDKLFRWNTTTNFTDGGQINSVSVGKQGKYVAFGGAAKQLYIWDQATSKLIEKFPIFGNAITSVRLSRDEDILVTGDFGGEIRIYAAKCHNFGCGSGEYANSTGSCKKCSDTMSFCVSCKTASSCEICMPGYYKAGTGCTACYSVMEYCLECHDNTECLKCLDGYYLDTPGTKKCLKCPQTGCIECNSTTVCTKCFKNDFYLDTTAKSCKQCADTLPYCIRCFDANNCSDCQIGFYKNSSKKCTECPANCLACQSDTYCTECKVGYWASSGSCIRCTNTGCISCNQTGVCYDCKEGMFLTTGNACSACTIPCATCSIAGSNCTGCILGSYLNAASFTCVKCIENCKVCNESGKCLSCFPGFAVDGTTSTCKACSNSFGNCSECTSAQCIRCREGFWIDTANSNVCKLCGGSISNCMSCSSQTNCTYCATGYFQNGATGANVCVTCSAGCQQCISSSNCTNCFPTFFKNSSLLCEPCKNKCFECTTDTNCLSCVVGYYLDVTTCKACQAILPYCSVCTDSATCIACMPGSYLDTDNKCKLCSLSNCLTCTKTSCQSCKVGFYLDTTASPNLCNKCSEFCQQCTSSSVCSSCIDGYFFDSSDKKCKPCAVTFPHCTLCNSTKCLQCDQGTEINTTNNNLCTPCGEFITNCKSCYWDNSATAVMKCSLCNFGYGLAANNLTCPSCNTISGCVECKSTTLCTKCEIGFFLNNVNQCVLCSSNCLTCNSATSCLACKDGYVFDGTACVLCQTKLNGCSRCIPNTATTFNCTYCQMGYFLASDKTCKICHQMIRGCYTCNDSSTCTACLDKYYLDTSTATANCKKCVTNIPGCQICNSSSVCLSCEDSYFLDTTTNKCKYCSNKIPGCLHCKSDSFCSQCDSGYFLTAGNSCNLCESVMEGCIYCNSLSYCVQCRAGYYLNTADTKCYKCSQPGCEVCSQNSPTVCVTCNSKYYLAGSRCATCQTRVPFCDQCDATNCLQCEVGHYLVSPSQCGICSSTMSGCSRCSSSTTCLQCMSSYFVNSSNLCQECNKVMFGCQNCIDGGTCISCEANFFLNSTSDKCQACTDISGCLLCRNQTMCVMCQQKYYMSGSECMLCSKVLRGCFSCASDKVCIQCQSGYMLDTVSYECKINTVEAKQAVEGLKLVTYYISKNMLKHILVAKGANFRTSSSINITANGLTKMFVEDFTGKEVQLTVLSYEYGTAGNSIIFYTDNPVSQQMQAKTKNMQFRLLSSTSTDDSNSLLAPQLNFQPRLLATEINLQVLVKMDESVYRQILPDLDYKGSMTVGYSLNNPEFMNSYMSAQSGNKYLMYEIVGIGTILLFLINYIVKFLFTMPQSRNRSTLLPHIIALKSCCLILYPAHFQYISFCKGFMVVDLPWLNGFIAQIFTDQSDHVQVPFGLFFTNMSIAGTFLLGFLAYVVMVLLIQAYFYITKQQPKPQQTKTQQTQSQIDSQEQRKHRQQFKIQNLQQAMGINYDNDQSQSNRQTVTKRNSLQLLWNIFTFSMVYYSCLSVQGAFFNYLQMITVNGLFYIFGMLVFIYVTIETFYAFFRNFKNISKVRIYIKACLLSLAHFNSIYIVSVCVIFDMLLAFMQFYIATKPNQFSKFFILTHFLSSVVIGLMIFVSGSLVSLFSTALCLILCFGFELFIHIKEYQNANKNVDDEEFKMEENEEKPQHQDENQNFNTTNNVWDLGRKTAFNKNSKSTRDIDMHASMEAFDKTHGDFEIDNNIELPQKTVYLPEVKILSGSNSVAEPVQVKYAGRRNKNRRTQEAFRSNVIEVIPNPLVEQKQLNAGKQSSIVSLGSSISP